MMSLPKHQASETEDALFSKTKTFFLISLKQTRARNRLCEICNWTALDLCRITILNFLMSTLIITFLLRILKNVLSPQMGYKPKKIKLHSFFNSTTWWCECTWSSLSSNILKRIHCGIWRLKDCCNLSLWHMDSEILKWFNHSDGDQCHHFFFSCSYESVWKKHELHYTK